MKTQSLQAVLAISLLAASNHCQGASSPSTPFVAALGGVWTGDGASIVPEILKSSINSAVIVETGTLPEPNGTYRAPRRRGLMAMKPLDNGLKLPKG